MTRYYVYKINDGDISSWQKHNDIPHWRMGLLVKSTFILNNYVDFDLTRNHEYWITECPFSEPFVLIRLNGNPYDFAYLVSPIKLEHLKQGQLNASASSKPPDQQETPPAEQQP